MIWVEEKWFRQTIDDTQDKRSLNNGNLGDKGWKIKSEYLQHKKCSHFSKNIEASKSVPKKKEKVKIDS